jgi:hypothetical protein
MNRGKDRVNLMWDRSPFNGIPAGGASPLRGRIAEERGATAVGAKAVHQQKGQGD